VDELLKNKLGLQVLTDTGWSNFEGILLKGIKNTVKLHTKHHTLTCTPDHKLYLPNYDMIEAGILKPEQEILVENSLDTIVSVTPSDAEPVYDLYKVEKNNRYYANDILVKNCEFLVYDETLVSSLCLATMEGIDPILKMGQARWYKKPKEDMIYVVSLDPAMGTGGNSAAIQVMELPSMDQVAEWHHNTTPIDDQIRILKNMCKYIAESCPKHNGSNIYWSVENNSVGEAALIVIKTMGEDNIPGLFISEPIRKGHVRKFRKGFNTTHKTKISACSRLKHLIETKKMKIHSKPLISELKSFIARGISFSAKSGEEDDLVSALLLSVRMFAVLADWHSNIYDAINDKLDDSDEDFEPPMPIFISTGI
jgi:hypothetical protein